MDIVADVLSILPGLAIASVFAVLVANGILYAVLSHRDKKLTKVIRSGLVCQKTFKA